jgi:hypothetical protein
MTPPYLRKPELYFASTTWQHRQRALSELVREWFAMPESDTISASNHFAH